MKECNICANHDCGLIKSGQKMMRTKHNVPVAAMRLSCKKYIKAEQLRVTMFEQLLAKQPRVDTRRKDVLTLLANMNMQFMETKRAPFFTFAYN